MKVLLINTKDKIEEGGKSNIYKTQCQDCDKYYVEQTKRNIDISFKEHLNNVKKERINKKINLL